MVTICIKNNVGFIIYGPNILSFPAVGTHFWIDNTVLKTVAGKVCVGNYVTVSRSHVWPNHSIPGYEYVANKHKEFQQVFENYNA